MTTALRTHCAVCHHPEHDLGICTVGPISVSVDYLDGFGIVYDNREQAEADGVVFGEFSDLERE